MKRELPLLATGLVGLLLLVDYFFEISTVKAAAAEVQNWGLIIAAFALAVAAVNLVRIHAARIAKGKLDSINSAILLGALLVTAISGIFFGTTSAAFDFMFQALMTPLAAAFFAMTAFHLASASYRAFRMKNAEAAVLLIAGILVMLGAAPIGEAIWSGFPVVGDWITGVVNSAGSRGILISTAVGSIGVSLRILTGIEQSHFGSGAE